MKKNLLTILILSAVIISGLTGCGDNPLSQAYNYIPNRAPVIDSLVIIDEFGTNLIDEPADYLGSNNDIYVTLTAQDPEGEALDIEFSSEFGSFSGKSTVDGITEVTFITNSNVRPGDPVSISIKLTDPAGMMTSREQILGSGNSGLQITETTEEGQSPFTHAYNFTTPEPADQRTFVFTSRIAGIYQIRTDEPVFNRHEAVYLYYPELGDTISITINNVDYPLGTEGPHDFYIIFRDTIGNEAAFTKTVIADDTAPDAGSVTFNDGDYTNSTTPEMTLTADCDTETESPVTHMWLTNNVSDFTDGTTASWIDFSASKSDWAIDGTADGSKTVYALFKDASGNITDTASPLEATITYDITKPTGTINISKTATNSQTIAIKPAADSDLSGVTDIAFSDSSNPSSYSWVSLPTAGSSTPYTLPDFTEGTKTVYAFFKDGAGNISSSAVSDTIIVDVTPPDDISGLTIESFNHRIELNWTNPSVDYSEVAVYRKEGSIPANYNDGEKILTGQAAGLSDTGQFLPGGGDLVNGTEYGYLIYIQDEAQNQSTGYGFLAAPNNNQPNKLLNFRFTNQSSTSVTLAWDLPAVPDPDGDELLYRIYASSGEAAGYTFIAEADKLLANISKATLESALGSADTFSLAVTSIDTEGLQSPGSDLLIASFAPDQTYASVGTYEDATADFRKISHYNSSAFIIDNGHSTTPLRGFDISDKTNPSLKSQNTAAGFSINLAVATGSKDVFITGGRFDKGFNQINRYTYNTLALSLYADYPKNYGSAAESGSRAILTSSSGLLIGSIEGLYTFNKTTYEVDTIDLNGLSSYDYKIWDMAYDGDNILVACEGEEGKSLWVNDGLFILSPNKIGGYEVQRFRPVSKFFVKGVFVKDGLAYICVESETASASGLYIAAPDTAGTYRQVGFVQFTPDNSFHDIAVIGRYAFVALGAPSVVGDDAIQVIDVGDPANPQLHDTITKIDAYQFSVSDNYLMIAAGESGLVIYEISDQ